MINFGPIILQRILSTIITKKRMIGWASAIGLAIGATAAGMKTDEFKSAVCEAPVIEREAPLIEQMEQPK